MKVFYRLLVFIIFVGLIITIAGCASIKKKKAEVITGIHGVVIPVDEKGNELVLQDRSKIIINVVPVENEGRKYESSITVNANSDGKFQVKLKKGEYEVEIFLEGFYVKSFNIKLEEGQFMDLGRVYLKKIQPKSAAPIKENEEHMNIQNEGDVNIQPPSY